jgi:hypothetical protein
VKGARLLGLLGAAVAFLAGAIRPSARLVSTDEGRALAAPIFPSGHGTTGRGSKRREPQPLLAHKVACWKCFDGRTKRHHRKCPKRANGLLMRRG